MSAIWFRAPLTCLNCGAVVGERDTRLHTPGLGHDATDTSVYPGELLEVSREELDDGYFLLHDPGDNPDIRVLEQWSCRICDRAQWARIDLHREDPEHYRFVSARSVPLTPETLAGMHFISRWMDLWVEANPGPETDRILPLIRHLLP